MTAETFLKTLAEYLFYAFLSIGVYILTWRVAYRYLGSREDSPQSQGFLRGSFRGQIDGGLGG